MNLQDAIGKDIYIIENDQYSDIDIKNMSMDELERLKMRVNLKIDGLSSVIKAKQIEYANGGEGTTKKWYVTHRYALTINQRMVPYINSLIKNIIKRRRSEKSLGDHFMEQARQLLPQNDFETILKNAQLKIEAAQ